MAWTQGYPEVFPSAFQSAFPGAAALEERAERALRWPVGAFSPLWAMFGAAASVGVAWWWLTRWTQVANVEAIAEAAAAEIGEAALAAADAELRVEEAVVLASEPAALQAAAPEPVAPPTVDQPLGAEPPADDLTRMVGIGPKLSAALAARGVTRFAQIAAWSADELAELDAALSLKGRAVREAWVAQARRLALG